MNFVSFLYPFLIDSFQKKKYNKAKKTTNVWYKKKQKTKQKNKTKTNKTNLIKIYGTKQKYICFALILVGFALFPFKQ